MAESDPILDLAQLSGNLGGADEATLVEVTEFFVTSVAPLIREAAGHVAARSGGELLRVAHAAKGAARNVCAPTLAEQLQQLESAAKAADWPAADRVMRLVSDSFGLVAERIAAAARDGAR
jgi:HPt (histidine-containing phosphotransfer) domain-containing protein